MKNVAKISAVTLYAIVALSLVAFAAKGPCVGGGSSSYGPTETVNGDTKTVESGTLYADQNCAGLNENDCTTICRRSDKKGWDNNYVYSMV